jgi:DNA-directed RNA polymerase sigma subunit (sigma70/sigma32)
MKYTFTESPTPEEIEKELGLPSLSVRKIIEGDKTIIETEKELTSEQETKLKEIMKSMYFKSKA